MMGCCDSAAGFLPLNVQLQANLGYTPLHIAACPHHGVRYMGVKGGPEAFSADLHCIACSNDMSTLHHGHYR